MTRTLVLLSLTAIVLSGCGGPVDIVRTPALKSLDEKCVHVETIQSQDKYIGQVLRDVLQKEFIRAKVALCDADTATITITGSTFLTIRSAGDAAALKKRKSPAANEAIESVSLIARDRTGQILLTASYDNDKQYTAGKLAKEFGRAVAAKMR